MEVDPKMEANRRFTIYEAMRESFLYLNKGQFRVTLINPQGYDSSTQTMESSSRQSSNLDASQQLGFEVTTADDSEVFFAENAHEWVALLNQLAL